MPWKKNTRTEIVHIVVTGYQKKKMPGSKYYVFVVDVTWNNSDRFEVYRRYSDFFSFQTTLKALFPGAAGRKNPSDRIIPQLPKRIFVGRSHVAKVAEARLEQINRYCQTLISLDPKISESAHVVGFFSPRIGDKQLPKLHLHRPASLHPEKIPLGSLFEEYCALAEYVAEDESQVNFKPGDKVLVMSKDESGWWMCNVDNHVGWAPPSYLKKCEDKMENESDESDEDDMTSCQNNSDDSGVGENSAPNTPASSIDSMQNKFLSPEIKAEAYKAIDSYQADGPGQVSFDIGDTIHVLDKLEDGWWFVSNGKEEGWAPCSYLEGDKDEEVVTNLEDIEKYYSVDKYQAEEDDEITFEKGVVVEVLQKSLDGWWVVKMDKVVGLAPATFLKKLENQEVDPTQTVRKVSPPSSDISPLRVFQQPPRKESVRLRASMRDNNRRHPNQKLQSSSLLQPIRAERSPSPSPSPAPSPSPSPAPPTPSRRDKPKEVQSPAERRTKSPESTAEQRVKSPEDTPERRVKSPEQRVKSPEQRVKSPEERVKSPENQKEKKSRPKMKIPLIKEQSEESPAEVSDSDPEENYLNYSFQQFNIDQMKKVTRGRRGSGSESSSVSEDSSSTRTYSTKRPVATPRKQRSVTTRESESSRPPIPPKPEDREGSPRPPLPPRPVDIPKMRKNKSMDDLPKQTLLQPSRPLRPRMSEIKRAKDRVRAAKNAPSLAVVDEDRLETMSNRTAKSAKSYTSSKSAPAFANKEATSGTSGGKKRAGTLIDPPEASQFLTPHQRPRRRSTPDGTAANKDLMSPPEVTSSSLPVEDGVLNCPDVTSTLLKMIMSSNDPALKAALRDLISQDSSTTNPDQVSTTQGQRSLLLVPDCPIPAQKELPSLPKLRRPSEPLPPSPRHLMAARQKS